MEPQTQEKPSLAYVEYRGVQWLYCNAVVFGRTARRSSRNRSQPATNAPRSASFWCIFFELASAAPRRVIALF
ncbi:MAG: hypothetical protein GY820_27780 [Gammaproteobacteria bacterium]|nr:hypothetical protein [Gammaproteobacteria bacterium]